ncbi:uncharacterized protein [Diadema antillarum]|uniref:uncharacterized protein n=1 Tax=Diadema antillarum TaxID=105358 RepID=UPI003A83BE5C
MAAPCVSCSVTSRCGDITTFKHALPSNDKELTHKSLRNAISKIQADVNAFLTKEVENEKLQAKSRGKNERTHSQQQEETAGGSDGDDFGLEDEEDGEDEDNSGDCPNTGQDSTKRNAEESCVSSANKKSKTSET